jgi:hypothetical protein
MFSNRKFLSTTISALVVFGALAITKAQAQQPTETISFTVTQAVNVGGHELTPGRYTVQPSSSNGALIIRRAESKQFVTFVLPVSRDLANGDNAAVKTINRDGESAVASVYFPENGRTYYFNTNVAAK